MAGSDAALPRASTPERRARNPYDRRVAEPRILLRASTA